MPKTWLLIILIFSLAVLFYFLFFYHPPLKNITIMLQNQSFDFEIASTIPQKTKGLGGRSSLCPNCGMIFVSALETPQIFWMKNTLIPLDIIFLDKNGVVINIFTATPEPNTPDLKLTLYKSLKPAKFVIELNAGTAQKLNLAPGSIVKLPF